MRRRKLVIALAAAAMFGVLVVPASAELHHVTVTLTNGETRTMTVDVPPGAAVDSIQIPGLPAPIQSITDLGPVATPTPTAAPPVTAAPDLTPTRPQEGEEDDAKDRVRARGNTGGGTGGGGRSPTQTGDIGHEPNAERLTGKLEETVKEEGEQVDESNPTRNPDGSPTLDNPTVSLATPGAARIGVPNFFIEKFRIPPFLLPIYQAAGIEYGVRWEVLAAINEIETDYGRNLNISSAGALGWMQFMPPTWDMYGVDANGDGEKDPFNPVDAIFAAARYLRAAGADKDLYRAIFAYNHADWYVESVLMRARVIGGLPADLVGSLSGLTQGRFPVGAKATYAGELPADGQTRPVEVGQNAAHVVESDGTRRAIRLFSRKGAPVIAVNDGRVTRMGRSRKLGKFIELQDSYGNTYQYSRLGKLATSYPFPKERKATRRELALPEADAAPKAAASKSRKPDLRGAGPGPSRTVKAKPAPAKQRLTAAGGSAALPAAMPSKERLFAHPGRPNAKRAGGTDQLGLGSPETLLLDGRRLDPRDFVAKRLKRGARVIGGTVLGQIGKTRVRLAPHVRFEIRPAGRGAPRIDPKPILDGWKLLESTAIYRSKKRNPFFGADAEAPSIGQIMLMSKEALQRHVLRNPSIDVYECGRHDIATGQVDRRVLATLEFLASSGLKPTVSSIRCGHGYLTAGGNVSEHSSGNAVDVAAINGVVISPATQGKGSITDLTIQRLLTLQGTMKPHQIISLMTFEGADNTFAMGDHADHIHIGFRPVYGANSKAARRVAAVLKPEQWIKLIDRISNIDNPEVREQPSKFSVAVTKRASEAHRGE